MAAALKEQDLVAENSKAELSIKYSDGQVHKVRPVFKPQYKDEYTGEMLPGAQCQAAIIDELDDFTKTCIGDCEEG